MTTTTDPRDAVIQSQTFSVGGLAAASTTNRTLTWAKPFPDANYWVSALFFEGNTAEIDALRLRGITSVTASDVTVRISNTSTSSFGSNVMLIGVWRPS